ncbi:alpha/beta hydrolase [Bacillus sp. PS06]|uniref:alpha/beta hydrolase n=1 Tax=Bacillus sp. PS06 TaxID=2764176 RepID=UPI0017841FAE|nr:alpha/beta hydrolase [Bacillus sp. PS06]MBD8068584.1 alpha/beta hydrolase [Bacillus sp. PS06]
MWKWEAENAVGVVVIIHGANEHHGRYKWLTKQWVDNGFHVLIGDLPGQGEVTKKQRGHIERFEEYLDEIEKWVKEAFTYHLPTFLLGHSMGGLISIRTLQERKLPVHGVILSSPCLGLVDPPSFGLDVLTKFLNITIPKLRVDSGVSIDKATRNDVLLSENIDPLYVKKVSVRWYRELNHAMKMAHKQVKKLPDIPLLVLQGGDDKIVNKKSVLYWFNLVNNKEKVYKEYPELFHEVFNEPERDEVFRYALQFVKNII